MKKIYVLFIALSAFLLTGCENDPITYNGPDFVSFSEKTISKVVRAGEDGIVTVEIGCANKSSEVRTFTVSVDAANTTAVEGTDFEFVSKSVTIPAGEYVGNIQIKGIYENLTPEIVTLTLKLDADAMIQEATTHSVKINLSRFFEFTMEWLEGDWIAQSAGGPNDEVYNIQIEKINKDTISINGLWGSTTKLKATVDWNNSLISIPMNGKYIFTSNSLGYCYGFSFVGGYLVEDPLVCNVTYNGIVTGTYALINQDYYGWAPVITVMQKVE